MKLRLNPRYISVYATVAVFLLLYLTSGLMYNSFFSADVLLNFFTDNSFTGIIAIGMTFVILTGGIDLSVGSMIALAGVLMATMVEKMGFNPLFAIAVVLVFGSLFGAGMGVVIQVFKAPPFIVTLGGMFLARGAGQLISLQSIPIQNKFFTDLLSFGISFPFGGTLTSLAMVFLAVFLVGLYLAHMTKFGRTVYAIGGSPSSAELMGLPVARTKILVYLLSGFCSALGGIVYTMYTSGAYGLAGMGSELDTIASVVIGGTLITGGVGFIAGTLFGVLIQGVIQTFITFQGTLSSWWARIVIGALLLAFILLQKLFSRVKVKVSEQA